ncbi:MAG: YlxR family protein [Candidatus Cloacimonetes bacterium]|nr:YlxR family protein [Candidatus Cloacimonadota bacterium]
MNFVIWKDWERKQSKRSKNRQSISKTRENCINKNSNAGHIPVRTCVICKKKDEQNKLLRFVLLENEIVFDLNKHVFARGNYLCDENKCLEKLDKWLKRSKKKNRK